jgi:hypothetical protein
MRDQLHVGQQWIVFSHMGNRAEWGADHRYDACEPTAAQAIMCNTTATPTTTTASIKCWTIQTTTLTLALITAGLNLVPATTAPSGTVVQIVALPPTQ